MFDDVIIFFPRSVECDYPFVNEHTAWLNLLVWEVACCTVVLITMVIQSCQSVPG
jgi:hypothetical protein